MRLHRPDPPRSRTSPTPALPGPAARRPAPPPAPPRRGRSLRSVSLVIACSATLLMVACVGAVHWVLAVADQRFAAVSRSRELMSEAYALAYAASRVQSERIAYLTTRDPRALAAYQRDAAGFRERHARVSALAGAGAVAEPLATVGELFERMARTAARDDVALGVTPLTDAQRSLITAQTERMEALQATLRQVIEAQAGAVAAETRASEQLSRSIGRVTVAVIALVVLSAAAAVLFFTRSVVGPIAELTTSAEAVTRGDLRRRVRIRRGDELGALASAFNRMAEQLDVQRRQDEVLRELRELMHGVQDLDEVLRILSLLAPECLPGTSGWIHLVDADGELLVPRGGWATTVERRPFAAASCWAFRLGRVHEASQRRIPCSHVHEPARGNVCIPLGARGETIGVLEVAFDGEVPRGVTELAETLALALANIRARAAMQAEAERDPLTGLFNRRHLDRTLARELVRAAHAGSPLTVILADVDHFKNFNDVHGHAAGDAVLRQLAATLRGACRESDVVCRYGGEEFVLLLPDCPLDEGVRKAEALRAALRGMTVSVDGRDLDRVTLSMGVAAFPVSGREPAALLESADRALYRAKAGGRDRVTSAAALALVAS